MRPFNVVNWFLLYSTDEVVGWIPNELIISKKQRTCLQPILLLLCLYSLIKIKLLRKNLLKYKIVTKYTFTFDISMMHENIHNI